MKPQLAHLDAQPTPRGPVGGKVCVIFNPTAKGERARSALLRLQALDSTCTLKPTLAAGAARALATSAIAEGYDTIVAMGGDGTVNEVINGMADAPNGFAQARLAVLPVGTVNVFARELGLPINFQRAWQVICRGREIRIDLPSLQFQTSQGTRTRWFAQMAGCGLDARAVELVDWQIKKRFGQIAYIVSGCKALAEPQTRIVVSDGTRREEGELVLLGNGRLYGGPIPVFEHADLADGLLDVCVFPKINWFVILRYACAYLSPRLLRRGAERSFQAASVRIESPAHTPVEVDGELVGQLPATCTLHRGVLRVIAEK